jgi:O-antigen/teichoic acid export membrane protein
MSSAANVDFIRESIITLLSDSLDKIAAFVAFVYFANYFSTEAFGAAYTVIGMSMMAGSVPKAIGVAVSKRVSEDTTAHDRYFVIGLGSILGFAVLAAAVVAVATRLFDSPLEGLALAGLAHLSARPVLYHVERVFDGVGQTGAAASLDFVDGVLTSVLRFGLILGLGMGAEGLLYSGALSAVGVGAVAYGTRFGFPTTPPTRAAVHDIKGFASWTVLTRIGGEVFHNAPVVLAGTLVSPTLASWLKSAQTLVMPSLMPVRSVVKSVFVQVSGDMERGGVGLDPIQNGIDVASILALPLLGGALVMGDALMVTIFGGGYGGSGYVLAAVGAAIAWQSQGRILTSVLSGADNPDATAATNAVHAVVYVALYAGALLTTGTTAFLVLLVVAYATWAGTSYWFLDRRVLDTSRLSWRFVGEQAVSGGVMALVVAGLWTQVTVRSWVDLVAPIGVGGVVYGIVLFAISSRSRTILRSILRRIPA